MSAQDHIQVMQDAYAALARGDGDAYVDFWTEDCEYNDSAAQLAGVQTWNFPISIHYSADSLPHPGLLRIE